MKVATAYACTGQKVFLHEDTVVICHPDEPGISWAYDIGDENIPAFVLKTLGKIGAKP